MTGIKTSFTVNLDFEPIKLPPVRDILVLGKKYPQGKIGVMESFKFIAPDEFEMFDIGPEIENVEAVLINKKILSRLPAEKILEILEENVYPFMSKGEAVKVNFKAKLTIDGIKGEIS
ncbi:hypothetical protein ACFL5V_06900 [Fibrobacterota bacterium]